MAAAIGSIGFGGSTSPFPNGGSQDTVGLLGGSQDTVGLLGGSQDTVGLLGGSQDTVGLLGGSQNTVGLLGGSQNTVGLLGGSQNTDPTEASSVSNNLPPPPPAVPGSGENQPSGTTLSIVPPPPPTDYEGESVGVGGSGQPPPPPPPGDNQTVQTKMNGITYKWLAQGKNVAGIRYGMDSKGNIYKYNSNNQTIANLNTGQVFQVKTEKNKNGESVANFSYSGPANLHGNIQITSSAGDSYTYAPSPLPTIIMPGDPMPLPLPLPPQALQGSTPNVLGMITENGSGQLYPVVMNFDQDTGQMEPMTWGPMMPGSNQFFWTDEQGNEPSASYGARRW